MVMVTVKLVNRLWLCRCLSSGTFAMKGGFGVADAFRKWKQSVIIFLISPLTFGIQCLFLKIASVCSLSKWNFDSRICLMTHLDSGWFLWIIIWCLWLNGALACLFRPLTLMMLSISNGCHKSNLLSFGTSSVIDR